jgi:uncharacterized protein
MIESDLLLSPASVSVAVPALYALASAAIAHRLSTPPKRAKPAVSPDAVEGLVHIELPSRGARAHRVSAWYLPARSPRGAVVVTHGIGMDKSFSFEPAQVALVRQLVDSGLSVLAIDLRGHGESDASRLSYGLHERLDVLGAVDWLLRRGYAPGTIGLLGASMGAVASIAAAAEEPAVAAVVADSAFADFGVMLWRNFLRRTPMRIGRALLPGTMLAGRWLLGAYMHRFSPVALARRLRGRPVLLVHAEGDRMVPADHCAWLAEAARATHWITPGGSHLSSFADQPDAYRERVFAFFDTHLARAANARQPARLPQQADETVARATHRLMPACRQGLRAPVSAFSALPPSA